MSMREVRDADLIHGSAGMLRRLFDEGFAAPSAVNGAQESLLAIRIGVDPYALRLPEIAGLYRDLEVVPVPSPVAPLLGIVGLRGTIVPVYDLASLLRYPPGTSLRWFVFAGSGSQLVGFAFEAFEEHIRARAESMAYGKDLGVDADGASREYTRGTVRAAGALRPIIHINAVMELIRKDTWTTTGRLGEK